MQPLVLKVDSIQLEFDGRMILQDIYLDCKQGEIVGLLGRNGCGKSSLLRIIFGILKPGYKHVSINDQYITKGYHQTRIAYLPQHNYLPHGIKIKELAKNFIDPQFWDEFTSLDIYQGHFNKTVGQLSGGELRQLETLMIVYNKADFILLDEPFTHISPVQADLFKPIIKRCAQHKGFIITDHQYRNIIDISDRLILISNGSTKHVKSPDDLITWGYINSID
ncbi:ATP-binding cassette domain-containing protein [Mucilaginibacter aquaedulcis]|jgi:lipopolysaccharide export system ATP-binding protein|uniref:ATP-binding cassette domain-containing protein n=1 Tax=Mucilaginibacter aquaedulcis TaxID=1187081 RepID=UPI0025B4B058|nr:ATP-binding cassette domain-containing protein [Mucilaginibacter aquaedulcis]MDN3547384.1 ATP-binding cassette domain-containing protein [Mucilaginibacter aquaedulcis]